MTQRILFIFLSILGLISFTVSAQCDSNKITGCTTADCHSNLLADADLHPKEKPCAACHQKLKGEHPDPQTINFTSIENCLDCHEKVTDYDLLHSPVAAGNCTICHKAHNHKIDNLHEPKDTICYKCHDRVIKEGDIVLHGKDSSIECGECHNTHGSYFPKLLRNQYSTYFFNDYQEKHYQLCFKCHKIDLLLHPQTSYNTNFRDQKNNLHFVHVNKKNKGRSCKACHEIHASPNPYLIADTISFGNWQMPINFISTENGGSCSPGCHGTATYDRRRKK